MPDTTEQNTTEQNTTEQNTNNKLDDINFYKTKIKQSPKALNTLTTSEQTNFKRENMIVSPLLAYKIAYLYENTTYKSKNQLLTLLLDKAITKEIKKILKEKE